MQACPARTAGKGETVVRTAPIQDLIGYALRRAQGVVYADLNDALARISLRPLQFTLLLMVAENPGASQSSVCEARNFFPAQQRTSQLVE